MATTIHTATRCLRCREILPAGSRVKRAVGGVTHQHHCAAPAPVAAPVSTDDAPATDRQIAYALALWAQHGAAQGEISQEEIRRLSRRQISQWIGIWSGH